MVYRLILRQISGSATGITILFSIDALFPLWLLTIWYKFPKKKKRKCQFWSTVHFYCPTVGMTDQIIYYSTCYPEALLTLTPLWTWTMTAPYWLGVDFIKLHTDVVTMSLYLCTTLSWHMYSYHTDHLSKLSVECLPIRNFRLIWQLHKETLCKMCNYY